VAARSTRWLSPRSGGLSSGNHFLFGNAATVAMLVWCRAVTRGEAGRFQELVVFGWFSVLFKLWGSCSFCQRRRRGGYIIFGGLNRGASNFAMVFSPVFLLYSIDYLQSQCLR